MIPTVPITKLKKVENKILVVNGLVKKTDYDVKVSDIQNKYFTTSYYNKFTKGILDAKIKKGITW